MSKANRVLQIVTHMNRGGLESMIMNYYRSIDRDRFQFDFLTHREHEGDFDAEIKKLGGRIYHVPPLNPFSGRYATALKQFYAAHPYRVVHAHLDCMSAYPLKAAKEAGVYKRIAHAHNTSQNKDIKYPIKLMSRGKIAKYATDLYACGREAGDWMYRGAPYTVLNNAIDARAYVYNADIRHEVRGSLRLDGKLVIGHIGSMNAVKNQTFLLEIFAALHEEMPESMLLLVGDGPDRKALEQKAAALRIADAVFFTGVRSDIPRLLQAMDVFVFPSLFEGLPVSLVEAQAAGLPCIVSDAVSVECRLTEQLRFLSLNRPARDWAGMIRRAAAVQRQDTYEEIRAAGYDVRENVKRLEELYQTGQEA